MQGGRIESREIAAEARWDGSLLSLLAANVFALAVAWATGMSLRELMLVYWMQSVVIGIASFVRMLCLKRFDSTGLKMGNRPVRPGMAGKLFLAGFFLFHYGFFHAGYLAFLTGGAIPGGDEEGSALGYALCAVGFVLNHGYSLLRNLASDARGRPKLGLLMTLPYARILPMHLTIILGSVLGGGAIYLFALLKVGADLAMHSVEHRMLRSEALARPRHP